MAAMQCEFRSSGDSHFYGTSPANDRIESWWSQYRRNCSTLWINYFKDLCERKLFNPDNDLERECLWFCFSDIIQSDLDFVKEHWNTHRICNSKHDTIPGIPDELYYFPERKRGEKNLALPIPSQQVQFVQVNLLEYDEDENIVEDYFKYIFENSGL